MNKKPRRLAFSLYGYLLFFLLVAFVTTCCMMLFLSTMAYATDIEFTKEMLGTAAKLTFLNVILLSALFTFIDALRRKYTVETPSKRIVSAANRLMQGDFSVRVSTKSSIGISDCFDDVIDCFNKLAEALASIETLRTDFIANVSHELKTPLTVIQNYSTMLSAPSLTEDERKEYAGVIMNTSKNLTTLITNILKLNKLENQQIHPVAEVYDLGEQLCECLLGFETAWESKELEIETDIEDGVLVKTDAEMMTLVWNNLFSNAIKFTDRGGKVSLSLKSEDGFALVKVADSGCGISNEVGAHIFDKFYQGDTSHATQGNGLGLTLVKRVIDITGSEITVSSEIGVGSVFTVKIRREKTE